MILPSGVKGIHLLLGLWLNKKLKMVMFCYLHTLFFSVHNSNYTNIYHHEVSGKIKAWFKFVAIC